MDPRTAQQGTARWRGEDHDSAMELPLTWEHVAARTAASPPRRPWHPCWRDDEREDQHAERRKSCSTRSGKKRHTSEE